MPYGAKAGAKSGAKARNEVQRRPNPLVGNSLSRRHQKAPRSGFTFNGPFRSATINGPNEAGSQAHRRGRNSSRYLPDRSRR